MPKTQLIYNQVGMFIGPAPSSGYHFIDTGGVLNNDFNDSDDNFNLVFPLNRITSASYSINPPRENVFNLSNLGTIKRPILNNSDVNLNFSYNLMGLVNEARMGFYLNTPTGDLMTGAFRYGTGRVSPISGMYCRDYTRSDDPQSVNWPFHYRDARNIFIAARKDTLDFNNMTGVQYSGIGHNDIYTYAFGDCYLNSYNVSLSVNKFSRASVNYTCNNIEIYSSGSGLDIPSINSQSQNINSGIKFNIPNNFQGNNSPTVLLPSDITIDIKQKSNNSTDLNDMVVDFSDIKIQDANFSFNINRKPLYAIGHKYPLDRALTFPMTCDISFNSIVGDSKAGSLAELLNRDDDYDITLQLNYQNNIGYFTGLAIQYEFINSKFNGFDGGISIGQRKNAQFSFTTELDPKNTNRGFFIKGYLGLWSWEEILLAAYDGGVVGALSIPQDILILLGYQSYQTPRPIF